MIKKHEEFYTFRGASPEQVADLCELWRGSVVDFCRHRGIVRIKSDRVSIDQFLMFYSLHECLESSESVEVQTDNPESSH